MSGEFENITQGHTESKEGTLSAIDQAGVVDLEVVIPAYNESERLERTLARIREYYESQPYSWRCTIISDGSKDNTFEIATQFAEHDSRFQALEYAKNPTSRPSLLSITTSVVVGSRSSRSAPRGQTAHTTSAAALQVVLES